MKKKETHRPHPGMSMVTCVGGPWDGREIELKSDTLGFWDRRMGTGSSHYQVVGNLALWMRRDET